METTGTIFDWNLFRRDVRRDVQRCALYVFFYYAIYLLVTAAIIIAVLLSSGIFNDLVGSVLEGGVSAVPQIDTYESLLGGETVALMAIAAIVAGSLVFLIPRKRRFFTDLALPAAEPMTPKIFIILVVVTQGIQFVYALIITLIDTLLPEGLSLADSYGAAMESLMTPLGFLYIIVVGPFFEELMFRGAILGMLRRFGENFAILFSSILFGFYHAVILQIPFGFVMGLLLGYVAARWSLRASVALHIVVNFMSVLLSDSGNESLTSIGGLAMLVCLIATVIFIRNWHEPLRERIRAGAPYYEHTYSSGFSSATLWIYMVVMAAFGVWQMNTLTSLL